MHITYELPIDIDDKKSVDVKFFIESGQQHVRHVVVPRNANGSINESEFISRLDSMIPVVKEKYNAGTISFKLPDQEK